MERSKPVLSQELIECLDWPLANWKNDNEFAIYVGKGRTAHADCKLKHQEMIKLYMNEFK